MGICLARARKAKRLYLFQTSHNSQYTHFPLSTFAGSLAAVKSVKSEKNEGSRGKVEAGRFSPASARLAPFPHGSIRLNHQCLSREDHEFNQLQRRRQVDGFGRASVVARSV